MMDSKRVCCFTGHRVISGADLPKLTRLLDETIERLVGEGVLYWGVGGAKPLSKFLASFHPIYLMSSR